MNTRKSEMRVNTERHGEIAIIRYFNPPLGYISNRGASLVAAAVREGLEDDSVRAIILTGGAEDVFIRHADVGQIARAARALEDGQIDPASWLNAPFPQLMALLDDAEKPVIAAINGICMGGGFEIALACTMRIIGRNVNRIGLPEIRIDIFPGSGGTQRLKRLLGWQRARVFALRGEVVAAADAVELGLVDEIADSPLDRAIEIASEVAARNRHAVAAILRVTRERDAQPGLEDELLTFAAMLQKDPTIRRRLEEFVEKDQRLDALT